MMATCIVITVHSPSSVKSLVTYHLLIEDVVRLGTISSSLTGESVVGIFNPLLSYPKHNSTYACTRKEVNKKKTYIGHASK